MLDTITTIDTPTDDPADDPTRPQKVRAWALHCQGLASPAITQRLSIPERTIRHWIATITSELAAEHHEQRATRLTLAIARKRHLSAAAWDGYERALAIEESQRTHTLAASEANDANDESATRAADQTARRALSVAAHFLRLVISIDRDLAALEAAFDEECAARERQQLEDEREQRERAWEQQREDERERERAELARERFLREQDRLDRAKERESEPRPPHTGDLSKIERLRELDHDDRAPIINAYFAAYDTYHAARRAADHYARYLDGTLDPYLPSAPGAESASEPENTHHQRHDTDLDAEPRRRATLPALSLADIAALTARLDAEEAVADSNAD